jgi:SAM-dependent methyltransferase
MTIGEGAGTFEAEIASGERFAFGENWREFLALLDDRRISAAEASLVAMLEVARLDGKTFLDIGSGSGLFSLAARRLGAEVRSLDFDPQSVWCTQHLKDRFFSGDARWQVQRASVLDRAAMEALPEHDIVYSWGVLHHTGRMYDAIDAAARRVRPGGLLYLALYRKTWLCPLWRIEKRLYLRSPRRLQEALQSAYLGVVGLAYRALRSGAKPPRGMDARKDVHDWLGGYPYESITPRELKDFLATRAFSVRKQKVKTEGVHLTPGCDEYVFQRAG